MNFRRIFGVNIPEVPQRDILIVVNMLRILSTFSRSSRLRVSCILWDSYHRNIVSMGYNGTESGTDNTMELNNVTLDTVIHAEMNALKKIGTLHSRNLICFITHSPCLKCAQELHRRGIHHVYYLENYRDYPGVTYLRNQNILTTRLVITT